MSFYNKLDIYEQKPNDRFIIKEKIDQIVDIIAKGAQEKKNFRLITLKKNMLELVKDACSKYRNLYGLGEIRNQFGIGIPQRHHTISEEANPIVANVFTFDFSNNNF